MTTETPTQIRCADAAGILGMRILAAMMQHEFGAKASIPCVEAGLKAYAEIKDQQEFLKGIQWLLNNRLIEYTVVGDDQLAGAFYPVSETFTLVLEFAPSSLPKNTSAPKTPSPAG